MTDLLQTATVLRTAIGEASKGLIERDVLVELIALSAVAREHLLVIGPPGTAKSQAVRRVASCLGATYFEYLLGRFTEPSEIFGPIDLRKLKDGVVETETAGMLPEAEIAFLDEVFLGSTAILNTLLGVLNERVFRRGHTVRKCPLRVCVGASNAVPEEESLAAFADRFLVRIYLGPVGDADLETLLDGGWSVSKNSDPQLLASLHQVDQLAEAAKRADMSAVRDDLAMAIRKLRNAGINLSDRRAVKIQHLVAAAAALAGRSHPTRADLWPIVYAVPNQDGQQIAKETLRELLASSENRALGAAAEDASAGPVARALRLVEAINKQLASAPSDREEKERWKLRLEGIAREIDAAFTPTTMPASLAEARGRIKAHLAGA